MTQILQKQQKTPSRNTAATHASKTPPVSNNQTVRNQAVALASLLQTTPPLGPVEITGHAADSKQERSSTMEIGEELVEESLSTLMDSNSSFVLLNNQVEIDRENKKQTSSTNKDSAQKETAETPSETSSDSSIFDDSNHQRLKLLNIVKNASSQEHSQSAPGSPRGRKLVQHFPVETDELSKSLPAMSLRSEAEERKQRAQRARQKAKSAAKLRAGNSTTNKK